MQELQILSFDERCNNKLVHFQIKEKDMDDSIVYDIFSDKNYIMTLSKEGKIIFNNDNKDFDVSCTNKIIQRFKKVLQI